MFHSSIKHFVRLYLIPPLNTTAFIQNPTFGNNCSYFTFTHITFTNIEVFSYETEFVFKCWIPEAQYAIIHQVFIDLLWLRNSYWINWFTSTMLNKLLTKLVYDVIESKPVTLTAAFLNITLLNAETLTESSKTWLNIYLSVFIELHSFRNTEFYLRYLHAKTFNGKVHSCSENALWILITKLKYLEIRLGLNRRIWTRFILSSLI